MGGQATIAFTETGGGVPARFYVHSEGYNVPAIMEAFYRWNETTHRDTRYNDMSYLAARFAAFFYAHNGNDGLGIGIDHQAHEGREWRVQEYPGGRPRLVDPEGVTVITGPLVSGYE